MGGCACSRRPKLPLRPRNGNAPTSLRRSSGILAGMIFSPTGRNGRRPMRRSMPGSPSLQRFRAQLAGGGSNLLAALKLRDQIGQLGYKVAYFASLWYDQDQRDNQINAKQQQVQILFAKDRPGVRLVRPGAPEGSSRTGAELDGGESGGKPAFKGYLKRGVRSRWGRRRRGRGSSPLPAPGWSSGAGRWRVPAGETIASWIGTTTAGFTARTKSIRLLERAPRRRQRYGEQVDAVRDPVDHVAGVKTSSVTRPP